MRGRFARCAWFVLAWGCSRGAPDLHAARPTSLPPVLVSDGGDPGLAHDAGLDAEAIDDAGFDAVGEAASPTVDGPHLLTLEPGRPIYYAFPGGTRDAGRGDGPWRLVAHLHGTCGPPPYACGTWIRAAVEVGALVCPTGNAHCGPSPLSPASWEAPSWGELVRDMDHDLERSIAIVEAHHKHAIRSEGAILTGYSRGGYAVPLLAGMHPGRWPFLLIIEADATLEPVALRRARVRAVALVAGELGKQIEPMRKAADALNAASIPARLFVMPRTGHLYSDNMEDVMRGALAFLVAHDVDLGPAP